jgi:osmotically inducible protein OsmC
MKRNGSAIWEGDVRHGKGSVSTASGVLANTPYSYSARFENGTGTNPEELLAAAHAGCFSMALSLVLGEAGLTPERIATTATITLDKQESGFAITESHLEVKAKIPGADQAAFEKATQIAKTNCPVSKLFNTEITLAATLE